MTLSFWKDKSVFLTGHTGFKGSWLSLFLKKLGVNLIGFSNSIPTTPSLFELTNVEDGMTSIMGDVRNYKHLEQILCEFKPEIIIHMAAQSIVRESYKNPIDTFETNIMGTVNLLESVRNTDSVRVVVNVTSDKCYEVKKIPNPYREDNPMGGYDPYSNSKGCSELVTSSYRNSFFNSEKYDEHKVAIATARSGNVIGGGDWGIDRLIPDIMKGIYENKIIKIRNPNAIRPWQFVLEPITGYLELAEKLWLNGPLFSEAWNFGPINDGKPVKWIVEKINELWNHPIKWYLDQENHPHEENQLQLDISKAISKLDWRPKLNLETALEWTIKWYMEYEQQHNMKEISEKQLNDFICIKQ